MYLTHTKLLYNFPYTVAFPLRKATVSFCLFKSKLKASIEYYLQEPFLTLFYTLTLKSNTERYCQGDNSSFMHTFQKFYRESRKIQVPKWLRIEKE